MWTGALSLFLFSMSNVTNSTGSIYPGVSSSDAKILSSFLLSCGLFVLLMAFFLLLRKRVPQVYESRTHDVDPPGGGLLGWAVSAWTVDRLWILKHRGLDAVVYLLTLKYMIFALAPCTLIGVVVLMPVYSAACHAGLSGLDSITIQNCVAGEPVLWVALAMCALFSVWIQLCLYLLFREVARLRIVFRSLQRPENYVLMVREIPRDLSANQLGQHFDVVARGECTSVLVCLRSRALHKLFLERAKAIRNLERCLANPSLSKMFVWWPWSPLSCLCCCDKKRVNGIDFWRSELQRLDDLIALKQQKKRQGAGVAFIGLRTIRSAQAVETFLFVSFVLSFLF